MVHAMAGDLITLPESGPAPWGELFFGSMLLLMLVFIVLWLRDQYYRDTLIQASEKLARAEIELQRAVREQDAERMRSSIAREIHDELGMQLTKITMLIAEVRRQEHDPTVRTTAYLDRIADLSRQANSSLNDILWAVDPEHDSIRDLVQHAKASTDRIIGNAHVRAEKHFAHNGPDRPIDPATKRSIFLLLKEALNNSLEYAGADNIQILLETDPEHFRIQVKDNGIGFEPEFSMTEGNGIRLMKARSAALGARFELIASKGKGCTVDIYGPLP